MYFSLQQYFVNDKCIEALNNYQMGSGSNFHKDSIPGKCRYDSGIYYKNSVGVAAIRGKILALRFSI